MEDLFIKKYWDEEDIQFLTHFQNGEAIRQIEISESGKVFLSTENPVQGESMLYDKDISTLEIENSDFISKEEFENEWNKQF